MSLLYYTHMFFGTLEFPANAIPHLLAGKKTATVRLAEKNHFEISQTVVMIEEQTGKPFAIARVLSVEQKPFTAFTEEDKNESGYNQPFEQFAKIVKETFHQTITPDTPVALIKFLIIDDGQKREHEVEPEEGAKKEESSKNHK